MPYAVVLIQFGTVKKRPQSPAVSDAHGACAVPSKALALLPGGTGK